MATLELIEYPAHDRPAPAFLVIPGGGYTHIAAGESKPVAAWLNSLGLHAAVLRYRVAPDAWPGALLDARDALAALRDGDCDFAVEPGRVGVIGFSAGGHLAGLLATDSPDLPGVPRHTFAGRPDAAILAYPLIELRETFDGRIPNAEHALVEQGLGDELSTELLAQLSVGTRVTSPEEEAMPPVFLWATSDDADVRVLHSTALMNSLAVAGVPFEAHIFPRGGHGLNLAVDDDSVGQWRGLAQRWLVGLGWLG